MRVYRPHRRRLLRAAMDDHSQTYWYLVRTKTGKERWVRDQLAQVVPEVFLPMLKAKAPRWGRMAVSIAPLFPCYVFARFDLQSQYFDVKYMAGVRAIVSAGTDPLAVPDVIVSEIRGRGVDDVIEIPTNRLAPASAWSSSMVRSVASRRSFSAISPVRSEWRFCSARSNRAVCASCCRRRQSLKIPDGCDRGPRIDCPRMLVGIAEGARGLLR